MINFYEKLFLTISENKELFPQKVKDTSEETRLYDLLKNTLTKEQDELFEKFLDEKFKINFIEITEAFEYGLKLGIKICN